MFKVFLPTSFSKEVGETPLVVSPLSTLSKFTLSGAYERFSFLGAAQTRKPFEKGLAKTFKHLVLRKLVSYEDISSNTYRSLRRYFF